MPQGNLERLNDFAIRKHCDNKCSSAFSADMKTTTKKRKESIRQKKLKDKEVPTIETDVQCPEHIQHIYAQRMLRGAAWMFQ
jgi:hypothetical protein